MDITETITHISLCAGYGGIDIGLKRAIPSLRTIAFSEIEAFACANLVAKMEEGLLDAAPIWTNLKTFPWEEFCGKVDILSGGYPCQPFSAAGKRLGTDDPRHLWPYIANGIRLMQPRVCFFENVEGHVSLGLRAVIEELESIGYKTSWGIFSAGEIGATHRRKRVFILASHPECHGVQRWTDACPQWQDAGADQAKQLPRYDFADQWKAIPEPSFWGVADGSAEIVDRNRLIGNGVVPATATHAFLILIKELNDKIKK
jgi:site-specific DNA-cytosine methylase